MTPAEVVALYAAAWREIDAEKRGDLLERSCVDAVEYVDPQAEVAGRSELATFIGAFLCAHPGHRLELASRVDAHHGVLRFAWRVDRPDGTVMGEGLDACELAEDGRLCRIAGFFGGL